MAGRAAKGATDGSHARLVDPLQVVVVGTRLHVVHDRVFPIVASIELNRLFEKDQVHSSLRIADSAREVESGAVPNSRGGLGGSTVEA